MAKVLLLSLIFLSSVFSKTIVIEEGFKRVNATLSTQFLRDLNNSLSSLDILKAKDLKTLQHSYQGYVKGPFWTKVKVINNSGKRETIAFINPQTGLNYIDVYVYKKNQLIEKHLLGDLREQEEREYLARNSLFKISLEDGEEITIISRLDNLNVHNLTWIIEDFFSYSQKETYQNIFWGLVGGALLIFMVYNLILFFVNREWGFFIVGLHALCFLIYQYSLHGVLYLLNTGLSLDIVTSFAWVLPFFNQLFVTLFPLFLFKMWKNYRKLSYIILINTGIIILSTSNIIYSLFVDAEHIYYIGVSANHVLINLILLMIFAFYFYIKKEVGSIYYLIGQGIVLAVVFLHTLGLANVITYQPYFKQLLSISIVLDLLFLLLAQQLRVKKRNELIKNSRESLIEQSHFNSFAKSVSNIVHQFRAPLTNLGSTFTFLQTLYNHDRAKFAEKYQEESESIQNSINFLQKSLNEFSNYYKRDLNKEEFLLKESIEKVGDILSSKVTLNNVTIDINIPQEFVINNYEHIFSNIFMILIDNSLDSFDKHKIDTNKINISITEEKNTYKLTFADNAGGITITPIEKIFEREVSTKEEKESMGIGLDIVKMLVEERLMGRIYAKNIQNGAEFTIEFPNIKSSNE